MGLHISWSIYMGLSPGGSANKSAAGLENRDERTIWLKTAPTWPETALFWYFGSDTAGIGMRFIFFGLNCSSNTELQ